MKAGDACGSLQVRGGSGGNAQGSGWRDGPRHSTGTRKRSTRTDSRDAPATLTLLDVRSTLGAEQYAATDA